MRYDGLYNQINHEELLWVIDMSNVIIAELNINEDEALLEACDLYRSSRATLIRDIVTIYG